MTHIVLMRHGRTAWNQQPRFRGQADVPLDEMGLMQATKTGRFLATHWPPATIYASPLQRTMQTAEAVSRETQAPFQALDSLLDIHFGELQGLTAEEAQETYPDLFTAWSTIPHTVQFPGGENLDVVRQRVCKTLSLIIDEHPDETTVLVSHTVYNRIMLCVVLGWDNSRFWDMGQSICAVNVFRPIEDKEHAYHIITLNSTAHLNHAHKSSQEEKR